MFIHFLCWLQSKLVWHYLLIVWPNLWDFQWIFSMWAPFLLTTQCSFFGPLTNIGFGSFDFPFIFFQIISPYFRVPWLSLLNLYCSTFRFHIFFLFVSFPHVLGLSILLCDIQPLLCMLCYVKLKHLLPFPILRSLH